MKAVNLIPQTERRGRSAVSRSGGGAYLVLGTLAALVLMMAVYVTEGGKIGSKQAEAAQSVNEATALEAKADSMQKYTSFAELKDKRVDTVTEIAGERFDWSNTLHDLARVIPPNTWLTCLRGTVSPAVSTTSCGGGSTSTVRTAIASPAVEITGCTTSQPGVARMMAKMRNIDDVTRVTLTSSEKLDQAAGAAASGDSSGDTSDCRQGNDQYPQFAIVVFFKPLPGQAAAAAATAGVAAPTSTTSTTGGTP